MRHHADLAKAKIEARSFTTGDAENTERRKSKRNFAIPENLRLALSVDCSLFGETPGWEYLLQCLFNLGDGNRPFAQDLPLFATQLDDRRRQRRSGLASVQY
jgi:hypothetical protein